MSLYKRLIIVALVTVVLSMQSADQRRQSDSSTAQTATAKVIFYVLPKKGGTQSGPPKDLGFRVSEK